MSLHTWHCQGPHKPSSCATYMLNSHGAQWPQATEEPGRLQSMGSLRVGHNQSNPACKTRDFFLPVAALPQ